MAMSYLILGVLWSVYLALHSILASFPVKRWSQQKLKLKGAPYRLFYTIISAVGLVAIYGYMQSIPSKLLFDVPIASYPGFVLILFGLWIVLLAFRHFSGLEFLGFSEPEAEDQLIRKGIHARVRHPIYTGTILVLLGYFLMTPSDLLLVSILVIFIYLPIGIYFEEKKLILQFGDDYLKYKQEVPSIIPRLT